MSVSERDAVAFGCGVAATATCLVAASWSEHIVLWPSTTAFLLVAACVPYIGLVATSVPASLTRFRWAPACVATALGILMLLGTEPVLSDDCYRFLWDARVTHHGISPYRHAPIAPALEPLRDRYWEHISYKELATIYPPLMQGLFWLADAIAHAPWSFQLLALLGHVSSVVVLSWLIDSSRIPFRIPRSAPWMLAINPLALSETALNGHLDSFVGLAALGFALSLAGKRLFLAAWFCSAASLLKLLGWVLLPLQTLWEWRCSKSHRLSAMRLTLAFGLSAASTAVLLSSGSSSHTASGLSAYASRWQGGSVLFPLAQHAALGLVELGVTDIPTAWLSRLITGTCFALFLFFVADIKGRGTKNSFAPEQQTYWVILGLLLVVPQLHPWYLLWLLPLAIASRNQAALPWSVVTFAAYSSLELWVQERRVYVAPLVALAQQWVVITALVLDALNDSKEVKLGVDSHGE